METTNQSLILLVEDHPTNLKILFHLLERSGFNVIAADNGESAIEKLQNAIPDLILLDVMMPGMDGFETCRRLKASPATKDIPVIFMTALSDTLDKLKGLNLGAVDYITKPFEQEEVIARVKLHLRLRNLTKKLEEQNVQLQQEIQERKRSEHTIRQQAALLDITKDAIFVRGSENHILFWNKGSEHLYGWKAEETVGKNADEILLSKNLSQLPNYQQSLTRDGTWEGELHQVTKDRKEIIVASRWTLMQDENGHPTKSILVVNTDITEKKQLEAQFLRAQRHESIGTLASGIAHEINNALTPILASIQLLGYKLPDEQSQRLLSILETNTKRSADLMKKVLSFARGVEGKRTILQVRDLILEIGQIIKQTFPKSILFRTDVQAENLWTIRGDSTQLHQVLMNLCVNARDAMPNGGILEISARNFWIDAQYARINIEAKVGAYVIVTVADTGIGIPAENLDRIFEPFFTTKDVGQGTGLGLSTVTGIIKSHNGFIKVFSEVGKGTQFNIYLPATQSIATEATPANSQEVGTGHGELILVVDDEDAILETTKTTLEHNAYKVLTASNGMEAIAQYAQHKQEIGVVLVDIIMPLMDGLTTIRTLQKMNPQAKIIAVSGLVSNYQMSEIMSAGVKKFLPKPYTSYDLLKNLQVVLQ